MQELSTDVNSRCSGQLECGAGTMMSVTHQRQPVVALGAIDLPRLRPNSDLAFFASLIADTDMALERLNEEISRLQERLKQLKLQRLQLERHRSQHKAIVSPFRRMPPEVLGEIFVWTLPATQDSPQRERFRTQQSPWVLTHISHRWRVVAIATPSLWSLVAISYHMRRDPWTSYPLAMVQTQIARARTLKIHFYGDKSLRDRVPLLRRLWLQWDSGESQPGSIDSFETAASLVDAGAYSEQHFIPIHLPAHQLTAYNLDAPWTTHKALLKLAHSLVEAHIIVRSDVEPLPDVQEIINLPTLRQLFLSEVKISDYLRVPGLVALTSCAERNELLTDVLSLIERSSCTLRRLCLSGAPSGDETAKILAKVPSIVELGIIGQTACLRGREEFTAIMSHFAPSGIEASLIGPQLQCVTFACQGDEDYVDYEAPLKILDARWDSPASALKTTALLVDSEYGLEYLSTAYCALRELRQKGLDVLVLDGQQGWESLQSWNINPLWN
ncbi:hypothetical protein DFH06DRAFT_1360232 [Mycena polygramma]|nr:hypothetical protein DFH06DRAFT_1360232 [Mycena polygramma]